MSRPPNILLVMADDHAANAISAYSDTLTHTPNLDRLGHEGIRFDACFCTNSICTPSRASILTGTYNHINGVVTLDTPMDNRLTTFPSLLREHGYQTAIVGKWHLGHGPNHDPASFDYWQVLYEQGEYFDPVFRTPGGDVRIEGYATDIITDLGLEWLEGRSDEDPFLLMLHHKAPHRPWEPDPKKSSMFTDIDLPEPHTFWDDYETRSAAAEIAKCRMMDLDPTDLKEPVPDGLSPQAEISWRYQRYIKDYLRCVSSIDDSMGRLLGYLDQRGWSDQTVVIYTSDQGFFLGEHGWFDKRFIYEESINMPLLIRYPPLIRPGSVCSELALNIDFAPTLLELAGAETPTIMQGRSLLPLLGGKEVSDWRKAMYYRYWMHDDPNHHVWAHYGVRTLTHKLIYFYNQGLGLPGTGQSMSDPAWELYDLVVDPFEINNLIGDPKYQDLADALRLTLEDLAERLGDTTLH